MNAEQNWIGKSAYEIRKHVIDVGGWVKVFPTGKLPLWAHRLRNAFNEPPRRLLRIEGSEAKKAIRSLIHAQGAKNKIVSRFTPSGDVYKEPFHDPLGSGGGWRYWIEMSQAGSQFHSKEQYGVVSSALLTHHFTGNFKLISADGTGGSSETCLHNWQTSDFLRIGKRSKADIGEWVNAYTQKIIQSKYRGSYNFADTMISGYDDHERLDMDPDVDHGADYKFIGRAEWTHMSGRTFKNFNF